MSSDMNRLLGKKREVRSDDDEEEEREQDKVLLKKAKTDKDDKNNQGKHDDEEDDDNDNDNDSQSDHQPTKTLFGSSETGFKSGIFGDLSNPSTQPKSLFGENKPTTDKPSLFSNTGANIFSQGSSLFDFSKIVSNNNNNNKNEDGEEDDDGDDDNEQVGKCDSPNHYNPTKDNTDSNSLFKKIYVKQVEFYLLDKESKTYKSKGEGFVSIETYEVEGKQNALILLRNKIGNLLFQGILNDKVNKLNSYEKKFKHVANFYFLVQVEEKEKEGEKKEKKMELSSAKIPFLSQEELKEFEEKYKEAIAFLKGEKK